MGEIWTIGHSNLSLEAFIALLEQFQIHQLADVRRFPGSRRHPHFNREDLDEELAKSAIAYRHFEGLGGRRSKRCIDSPNDGWRVESFNAYADYMGSTEFHDELDELISFAKLGRTSLMCSEALPWRCHRRLIADALLVRGWSVWDIVGKKAARPHPLTEFARVEGTKITYPAAPLFE